jgi:hypothetical protein
MARKSLVATVVGIAAFAVPNAFADKGGIPHNGSNGQGRPVSTQQTAATAPHGKALAKGHAKTHSNANANSNAKSHTTGRALAKGHAKSHGNSAAPSTAAPKTTPQGPPASNTHAKAGKTTICHATGSATNPYVTITISNNALPAHQRHQDGRDIIPASGGCPQGGTQENAPGEQQGKTTICHATGSATNPFVIITISNSALPAHTAHQDGRDIIPAPANGVCAAQNEQPGGGQLLTPGTTGSSVTPTMAPGITPTAGGPTVAGTTTGTTPNRVKVLGATTSGSSPSASTSPAATATRASSSSSLPFTGTDAIIVAILGLAALLIGVTMRRAAAVRSERS